jgi:xylulokinase
MSDTLALGIDVGLSGVRAAVMDLRGRVVATSARHPIPIRSSFGRAEHDASDWLAGAELAGRSAVRGVDPQRVRAIGVSALGPAPVLVSADLEPLAPALLFSLDTRAEDERRRLAGSLGLTDDRLNHDHAIPKLLWWRDSDPAVWEKAAWALDAAGFVVSHLTGTPTMDTITACDYRLDAYPCPIGLPEPRLPLSLAGSLRAAWAERLGLPSGVPVITGTYDAYADTAATGTLDDGDACVIFGSTLIIGMVRPDVPDDLHGLVAAPHLGDGVLVGGWTATGASALAWARRLLGAGPAFGDALEAAAARTSPGGGGLIFLPYLSGERSPVHDAAARGVLLGLTSATTGAEVYRAVVDGIALSVRDHAVRLAALGAAPPRWRAGGGASASEILVQAAGDALGAPFEVVADAGAAVGPCRLALRGIGHVPDVAVERVLEPDARRGELYDALYDTYRGLYGALSDQMHRLTEINRANGGGE